MTLRTRLNASFVAVALGPVLLGSALAGGALGVMGRWSVADRLDQAADAVQTTLAAQCQRLAAEARAIAILTADGTRPELAQRAVDQGVAVTVRLTDGSGNPVLTAGANPPAPWAECASQVGGAGTGVTEPASNEPGSSAGSTGTVPAGVPSPGGAVPSDGVGYQALTARVTMRAGDGRVTGYAYAAAPLDYAFLQRLNAATGLTVILLPTGTGGPTPQTDPVVAAAYRTAGDQVVEASDGRWVRRVNPSSTQPLALAISAPPGYAGPRRALLLASVVAAGLAAVIVAWLLARGATRPLAALAEAVERAAGGDFSARMPVRKPDEVGRLSTSFNRMSREIQAYTQALAASRDQLRGGLGTLGDTLASTHDLDRILGVILRAALTATSARAGVVLLVNRPVPGEPGQQVRGSTPEMLIGRCGVGLAGRGPNGSPIEVTRLRLPVGAGLLGEVAASGEPRWGRPGADGTPVDQEPRCQNFVAVPLTRPEAPVAGAPATPVAAGRGPAGDPDTGSRLLGVLALYDHLGGDGFDEADATTLRAFAGQAAVAVENVLRHDEAQRLSVTDPLTGLWNYRHLRESLRLEVERASRFGRSLGVLALDLDRFKQVNDSYGHRAGDTVLAEFARRVRDVIREVDLAFRQGGEEFVVLLPETDAAGCVTVAQRLGATVRSRPFVVGPRRGITDEDVTGLLIPITVSIGIGVFPDHATTGIEVLDAADEALYQAKAAGRDTYVLAAPGRGGNPGTGIGGASSALPPPRQSRGG